MLPDCPVQPLRQHDKTGLGTTAPFIGTMVQKYNCILLKFNDLRFAYFGETVNERNEMKAELISFITIVKTLSQYQYRVIQKLVYHGMINVSICNGCNGRNFISSVFR